MSRIPSVGNAATPPPKTKSNDMRDVDMDQFLQLLIAEMQNQDPMNPMDNSEFLQQISQMREISATNMLSDTLQSVLTGQNLSTASSLIGKEVSALTDDSQNVEGTVERVSVDVDPNNEDKRTIRVHIGPHQVRLKNIRQVLGGDQQQAAETE